MTGVIEKRAVHPLFLSNDYCTTGSWIACLIGFLALFMGRTANIPMAEFGKDPATAPWSVTDVLVVKVNLQAGKGLMGALVAGEQKAGGDR
jgi:hypothetical protein